MRQERLYHSHLEHWRHQQETGTLPATSGKPGKSAEAEELARLRAENKKLKARNDKLQSELGKTKTALDIAGKAFAAGGHLRQRGLRRELNQVIDAYLPAMEEAIGTSGACAVLGKSRATLGMVNGMTNPGSIEGRLRQAASLPEVLTAAFDTFEGIRIAARHGQDRASALFAAFMMTADAAVDGREALTLAPSLPLDADLEPALAAPAQADPALAADALARLAATLCDCLTQTASEAGEPGDRDACRDAAHAAARICRLMRR